MVIGDSLCNILQKNRFTGARRCDNQRTLAFALRRDNVDDPRRFVFDRGVKRVERQFLIGIKRRQIVKIDAMTHSVRIVKIDFHQFGQGKIAFAIFGCPDFAFDSIPGAQSILSNHIGRYIDVVRPGEVICFR